MFDTLKKNFLPALAQVGYSLVYFLFIVPLDIWIKAVERLAIQKKNGSLRIASINSPWPFLSWLKALMLEFAFDFAIFICYFIGPLVAIYMLFAGGGFFGFLTTLVGFYYYPVFINAFRDIFQLAILPIRKFISWCRKPAQYLDLKVEKKAE